MMYTNNKSNFDTSWFSSAMTPQVVAMEFATQFPPLSFKALFLTPDAVTL